MLTSRNTQRGLTGKQTLAQWFPKTPSSLHDGRLTKPLNDGTAWFTRLKRMLVNMQGPGRQGRNKEEVRALWSPRLRSSPKSLEAGPAGFF